MDRRDPRNHSIDSAFIERVQRRDANRAQTLALLSEAAPKDIEELIPILMERVREAKLAYDKAADELANALIVSESNKELGRT